MKDILDKIDLVADAAGAERATYESQIRELETQLEMARIDADVAKATAAMHEKSSRLYQQQAVDAISTLMSPVDRDHALAAENAVLLRRLPSLVMEVAEEITEDTKKMLAAHTLATLVIKHDIWLHSVEGYAGYDDKTWADALLEFQGENL